MPKVHPSRLPAARVGAGGLLVVRCSSGQDIQHFAVSPTGALSDRTAGTTGMTGFNQPLDLPLPRPPHRVSPMWTERSRCGGWGSGTRRRARSPPRPAAPVRAREAGTS
ncbi:hypothetical protein GCM10018963_05430 [Saccharothrix longispora]